MYYHFSHINGFLAVKMLHTLATLQTNDANKSELPHFQIPQNVLLKVPKVNQQDTGKVSNYEQL